MQNRWWIRRRLLTKKVLVKARFPTCFVSPPMGPVGGRAWIDAMHGDVSIWSETAAWVEAVGAIAAVIGSGYVAASESRATRLREDRTEAATLLKELRTDLATRTAALNLAILASTQIYDLHILLKDEAWRGRIARVSPSRSFLATERMLTAFPIQSLGNAPAMVEFSRFPASLAIAAEIYENLETAVRAANQGDRAAIFEAGNTQMERLDNSTKRQLRALRKALKLEIGTATEAALGAAQAGKLTTHSTKSPSGFSRWFRSFYI